ncbi:hypothetical protein VM98_31860 [Streptomyces rubellomurinus subsp. indigoferus]|nr:hypothetical protein VM98_31860 [Streptomyces rubellomurinus subsp. indigoferus]
MAAGVPDVVALLGTVRAGLEPELDAAAGAPVDRRRPWRLAAWLTPVAAPWFAMTAALSCSGYRQLAVLAGEAPR